MVQQQNETKKKWKNKIAYKNRQVISLKIGTKNPCGANFNLCNEKFLKPKFILIKIITKYIIIIVVYLLGRTSKLILNLGIGAIGETIKITILSASFVLIVFIFFLLSSILVSWFFHVLISFFLFCLLICHYSFNFDVHVYPIDWPKSN